MNKTKQFDHILRPLNLRRKLVGVLIAACYGAAQANPALPQVVAGQATFNQQGNLFSIANTPNTIINWQSFSINPNEITRFIQQSGDSKVLNRILGQDPSQILGSLQSNGKVFLINPNGVLFGKDARIDVNGLVASSLALSNSDFLAGKHNFTAGANAGKVVNQGRITTPGGGQVYLIAPNVENSGVITSPQGDVVLAAGNSVQLVDSADPAVQVVVSAPADQALNLGQIVAQGGRIGIYGALVNQRGNVSADSAVLGANGKIVLKASGTTLLEAGSRTSAVNSAGKGGEIQILGQRVGLTGDAQVDASGAAGGGTVLLGGDYQGKNPGVPNAQQAYLGQDARIAADATVSGQGGKVVVWGDDTARAYGSISVRGGAHGGDGGLAETSSHYLDVDGIRVDAGAASGRQGSWLLDPYNIEVTSTGGTDLGAVSAFASGSASGISTIRASTLNAATTNVVLQARNDISFKAAVSIVKSGVRLTAQAGNDINVEAAITTKNGAVTLRANENAGPASGVGAVKITAPITTGGGMLSLSGADIAIDDVLSVGLGDVDVRVNKSGGGIVLGETGGINGTSNATTAIGLFSFVGDHVTLEGNIVGGDPTQGTTVSFAPFTPGRAIQLGGGKEGDKLILTAAELGRVSAASLNIGNSGSSGSIDVVQDLSLGNVRNLILENAGDIDIGANVHLTDAASSIYAGTYGSDAGIGFEGGSFKAHNITLRSDYMSWGGMAGTLDASGSVNLNPYTLSARIRLGTDAYIEDGNPFLALNEVDLLAISTPNLNIGTIPAYHGTLSVNGSLNLATLNGKTATNRLTLGSGATLVVDGELTVANRLALVSKGGITQSEAIIAPELAILANGNVTLLEENHVGKLAAVLKSPNSEILGHLTFNNADSLQIASFADASATPATLNGVTTPGDVMLTVGGALTSAGTGAITANKLTIVADSIGTATAGDVTGQALVTKVAWLNAESTAVDASINIVNNSKIKPAKLTVNRLEVASGGGSVTLNNFGATVVEAGGLVKTYTGDIKLIAHSPLTINGEVSTGAGNIQLEAGSSGSSADVLSFGSSALVTSTTGSITLEAGAGINLGLATVTAGGGLVSLPGQNPSVPPVTPPVVVPPVVVPPVVTPPVVTPPVVTPPVVTPPVVTPPVVTPPVVTPPVVTPPVVTPPVVTPPVTPPPSPVPTPDICTIAPNSALCLVISPPTASEPVKPVQQASNEVIKVINSVVPKVDRSEPLQLEAKGGGASAGTGGPAATSSTPADKADDKKKDDKSDVALNDKSGVKKDDIAKKMYCN